jgi:hypothetical protein
MDRSGVHDDVTARYREPPGGASPLQVEITLPDGTHVGSDLGCAVLPPEPGDHDR